MSLHLNWLTGALFPQNTRRETTLENGRSNVATCDRKRGNERFATHRPDDLDEVELVARDLEARGRFGLTRGFIQHGDVTVHEHVISVARTGLAMAGFLERLGTRIDRTSLIRGALLHDYFLYDWHVPDPSHHLHGFTHPAAALARAEEDFVLTPRERNIIARHMFPLVPIPPTCREAWLVCLADKVCALHETIAGRLPKCSAAPKEMSR